MNTCQCCKNPAEYNILLFGDSERWYIPNQSRDDVPELLEVVWFCKPCMRKIEDNFRATISGLTLFAADKGGAGSAPEVLPSK